jgi:hypothetical protein
MLLASGALKWKGGHGMAPTLELKMGGLIDRQQAGRPMFGLPPSFPGLRWTSRDGGADDLGLAHGWPRPDPSPLIVVGVMAARFGRLTVDIYDSLGTFLILAERARNDPGFQYETRDHAAIDRALSAIPGREAWHPTRIRLDGVRRSFELLVRNGDWIAVHDLGDEWLWVHIEQSDSEVNATEIVTITDIASYLGSNRLESDRPHPLAG